MLKIVNENNRKLESNKDIFYAVFEKYPELAPVVETFKNLEVEIEETNAKLGKLSADLIEIRKEINCIYELIDN